MTDVVSQLTLFGPEALLLSDKVEVLRKLANEYKDLVGQHDRIITCMMGSPTSAMLSINGTRHGSNRHSQTDIRLDPRVIRETLEFTHQRILKDMQAKYAELQALKDTI